MDLLWDSNDFSSKVMRLVCVHIVASEKHLRLCRIVKVEASLHVLKLLYGDLLSPFLYGRIPKPFKVRCALLQSLEYLLEEHAIHYVGATEIA